MDNKPNSNSYPPSYIKTDDNKIINEQAIRWVKKMNDCLEVYVKLEGCISGINTHRICKAYSPHSYEKLNAHFE